MTTLAAALELDELRLAWLPIVDLGTGRVAGVEALLRVESATASRPLDVLVAEAEAAGEMAEVGRWVLRTALHAVAAFDEPLRLSVNLSGAELLDPDLPGALGDALAWSGHPAHLLHLEISERSLTADTEQLAAAMTALRDHGVRLSIDDFGTGMSSLRQLQDLPVDELKIDRSFVARMHEDARSAAIVRGVVHLARSLRLSLLAEGVELPAQERMLLGLRCPSAQGWLYARPQPTLVEAVASVDAAAVRNRTMADGDAALWSGLGSEAVAVRIVEAAFAGTSIGMALIDGTGTHLAVNPALSTLLDVPVADLVGTSCWDAVHPDDVPRDQALLDAVLRGERDGYVLEERLVGADGREHWVEVTVGGAPGDGAPSRGTVRLLRQVRSIADRLEARAAAEALERLNRELADQAAFLIDANGRLTSLASTLTHDLQQPLAALGGFLHLLATHRSDAFDADAGEWLGAANRSYRRLTEAVQALTRTALGTPGELEAVDLEDVFTEVVEDLSSSLRSAGASVDIGALPRVLADRSMLVRVATNLLANAVRYREPSRPARIEVRRRRSVGGQAVIEVADNGRGFDPDEVEAVFGGGTRGRAAEGTDGTGTGLAIVRSAITALDGHVWAEPREPHGAVVCFSLTELADEESLAG